MGKPTNKMGKGKPRDGFDVNAFIGGADQSAVQETPQAEPKVEKPKRAPKAKAPEPWKQEPEQPLVQVTIKMTPRQKAMFDYLRDETRVPTNARLLKETVAKAEAEATELWKKKQG